MREEQYTRYNADSLPMGVPDCRTHSLYISAVWFPVICFIEPELRALLSESYLLMFNLVPKIERYLMLKKFLHISILSVIPEPPTNEGVYSNTCHSFIVVFNDN